MNLDQLAAAGLCAMLLTACTGDDQPIGSPTSAVTSSSTSTGPDSVASPSASSPASGSPSSAAAFPVLRAEGVQARDLAEGVGIDPDGVVAALTWTDQLGANTLVLRDIGQDDVDSELLLYVDHLVQVGQEVRLLRQVRDSVTDCPVDKKLEFVDQALQIRDDDGDDVGEAVFAYRLNCAGDPSASTLKVLLLENAEKYILRGSSTNQIDDRGGPPVPEPAPSAWPAGSFAFARALYTEIQPES